MNKLQDILERHIAKNDQDTKNKLLGASFLVVNKDGNLFSGSAGRIDLQPEARAFDTQSFSWIASMSKLITTTAVMQLVDRGTLGLDEDVRRFVPELATVQVLRNFKNGLPVLEDNTKPITLRILLSHTSGYGYDQADTELTKWAQATNRKASSTDWSREGFTLPLRFAPGNGWYYGVGIDWAGFVLEAVTKQTLSAYMKENVFDPLGMRDTTFWPGERFDDRMVASTYRRQGRDGDEDDGTLEVGPLIVPKDEHEVESGGGGIFTTAADFGTFLRGLLGGKVVSQRTLDEMLRPQLNAHQASMLEMITYHFDIQDGIAPEFPTGLKLNHGLGGVINMVDVPGKRPKGSMMWSGAVNSRWWIDKNNGIAALLFTNVQPHGDPVVKKLYDELEREVYRNKAHFSLPKEEEKKMPY